MSRRSHRPGATPGSRRTAGQRLVLAMAVLSVLGCIVLAAGVGWIYWKTGRFHHADVALDAVATADSPRNYLIIGSDSREGVDGRRADVILVIRIDPAAGSVNMLSIPRDLWVPIAGASHSAKINSAYASGDSLAEGAQALIDTIRTSFGIPINNYLDVNFETFRSAIDEVGGVDLWIDKALRDREVGLEIPEPGCIHLDGSQALNLARSRHTQYRTANGKWKEDGTADLGRITRQHALVRKAIAAALDADFTSPLKAQRLLDVAVQNLVLDQSLDRDDLLSLAQRFKDLDEAGIGTYSLPTEPKRIDDQEALLLQDRDARPLLNLFRGLPVNALPEGDVTVRVHNGTAVNGRAKDVQDALTAVGFVVPKVGSTQARPAATVVRYAPGSEVAADLLGRHLTTPPTYEADPDLGADTVDLVIGADFTTVSRVARWIFAAPGPTIPTTVPADPTATTDPAASATPEIDANEVGISTGEPPPGVEC